MTRIKTKKKTHARTKAKAKKPASKTAAKAKAKSKAKPKPSAKAKIPAAELVQPLIDQALLARDAGNFVVAASLFEHAALASPSDWRLPNEAGVLYFRAEHYDDALRCYDAALALKPGDMLVLFNKALAHALAEDANAALAVLRDVLAIDATYGPAHFEIGKIHQQRGELAEAYACFETALTSVQPGTTANPRLVALVHLNQARIRFEQGHDAGALDRVRALWDAVQDGPTIVKLARELEARGQHARARAVVDVLLGVDPDDADAVELARAYRRA